MDASDISRFWSLVDRRGPEDCWPWTMGCNSTGYGNFNTKGREVFNAHRLAAVLTFGPPENGEHVLHSCDNRICCNPSHLRYGTARDNMKDCKDRGRLSAPPRARPGKFQPVKGERTWNAVLTETKVREIWRLHLLNKNTAEIAAATQSPRNAVADVCRARTWRHLKHAPSKDELAKGGVRRGGLFKP